MNSNTDLSPPALPSPSDPVAPVVESHDRLTMVGPVRHRHHASPGSSDEGATTVRSPWLFRSPLLAAAALVCLINAYNLYHLVRADSPRNPWESAEVVEAWRSLEGMPVYERSPDGHSTHMYGALVPWVQGEIFRWVGPNNISGRLLTLVSALATVTLIAATMRANRSAWLLAVAWAVIFGANHRSLGYFAENRPDMTAMMFSAMALLLMGYGQETRRGSFVVMGSACLVVGFFFKQTAAPFAAVPIGATVLRGRWPSRAEIVLALLPLGILGGAILGLKLTSPVIYFYMIEVPGSYAINWPKAARVPWELLLDSPLFLVLLGQWIVIDGGSLRKDPRLLWIAAVLAVAIPFSAISSAKAGGAPNSILPALLSLMAFCALRLSTLTQYLERPASTARSRLLLGTFIGVLITMTTFPHLTREHGLLVRGPLRDREYWKTVALVKTLPGTVVCPEDPTIPMYAKRHAGRNIFTEYDAHVVNHDWPVSTPEPVLSEIRSADFVVDVPDVLHHILGDRLLRDLGFEAVGSVPFEPAYYRIWRRKSVDTTWSDGTHRALERE